MSTKKIRNDPFYSVIVAVFIFVIFPNLGFGIQNTPVAEWAIKKLDKYLERLVPFGYSGAVLVAQGDTILLNIGYGLAIDAKGIPNTSETVFSIGSITKPFTSVAIHKLYEQKKLSPDDRIIRYFEDVPEAYRSITIHQLLTHTSGMAPYTGGDFQQQSREEMVREAFRRGLDFPPGQGYTYSNAGYSVLAVIIEKVSGQSYESYLREHILLPSGMGNTGYKLPDWSSNTVAHYYTNGNDNGTMLDKEGFPQWTILGNGGLHSTTEDMFRFHRALMDNDILSEETKQKMYEAERGSDASGWKVTNSPYGKVVAHTGGSSVGVGAVFRRYVDRDVAIVIFTNRDGDAVLFNSGLSKKIESMVFGKAVSLPPTVTRRTADLEKYAGRYEITDQDYYEVIRVADRMKVRVFGQKAINALLPKGSEYHGAFNAINDKAKLVLNAFTENDTLVLGEYSGFHPERLGKILQSRIDNGSQRFGSFERFNVLGTVRDHYTDFGDYMSFIRIEFSNGNNLFRFHWADGKVEGIGGSGFSEPMLFSIIYGRDGSWKGYHIAMELSIRLHIEIGESNSGAMFPGKSVKAVRETSKGK